MRTFCTISLLFIWLNTKGQIDSLQLNYNHYALPNGLEVILQPDKNTSQVSVEFWIRDGTSIDNPEKYGLQHFFEHVMPYSRMDSIKENMLLNSYLKGSNAQVKKDFSRFYLEVVPEGLELAVERAAGRLTAGANAITDRHVEYQRKRVLSEIERNDRNPHWSAEGTLAINEGTFGQGHPYAANGYGKIENNKAFSLNDFKQRYEDVIYAENIILILVGNFDEAKAIELIHQYFSKIKSKQKSERGSQSVMQSDKGISMKAPHPKDSLNTLVLSWAIANWELIDDAGLKLVAAHLNEIFKKSEYLPSSVVKSVVYAEMYKNAGQFQILIQFLNNKDSMEIEKLILRKIRELTKKNLTEFDLNVAKNREIQNIKEMLEKLGFQGSRTELLGTSLLFYNNPNAYFQRLKLQQGLTEDQVRKISEKWIKSKPFRVLFTPIGK